LKQDSEKLLVDDHAELGDLIERIFATIDETDAGGLFASLDLFFARLAVHIRAEHLHLFPTLLKASPTDRTIEVLLADLREDHNFFMNELKGMIKTIRPFTDPNSPYPAQSDLEDVHRRLTRISQRLDIHNEVEETRIYPMVNSVLSLSDSLVLAKHVKSEIENLPPRFS